MAHLGIGQWAGFVFTEYSVTVPSNQVVLPFADAARKNAEQIPPEPPHATQFRQHSSHPLIASKNKLGGCAIVEDNVESIQSVWVESMAFEDRARDSALQGSETKTIFAITLQDELDEAVAESADAVVEDNGMGIGHALKSEFRSQNAEVRHFGLTSEF